MSRLQILALSCGSSCKLLRTIHLQLLLLLLPLLLLLLLPVAVVVVVVIIVIVVDAVVVRVFSVVVVAGALVMVVVVIVAVVNAAVACCCWHGRRRCAVVVAGILVVIADLRSWFDNLGRRLRIGRRMEWIALLALAAEDSTSLAHLGQAAAMSPGAARRGLFIVFRLPNRLLRLCRCFVTGLPILAESTCATRDCQMAMRLA
mmetsp:Transcript_43965/g.77873  ORF Transcript_43965/g.77873 Transcript_43965/m.77873 type:complete len:203 (-) Transcript_43965:334-942(-)